MSNIKESITPRTVKLAEYLPSPWVIDNVSLDVRLDPERTQVSSVLKVKANPLSAQSGQKLVLDGEELELVSLGLNGKKLPANAYHLDETSLTIHEPPDESFTLQIETICNPKANTALSGLYLSNGIYCTQCEAEGFRRISFFLDRPDVLATYRVRLEAAVNEASVLLANGNLVDFGGSEDMRQFAVWEDPFPKPSYLFAMVAGNLASVEDHFTTMSGREVVLRIFVEPGKQDRCAYAMDALKRAMKWDEEMFGREYDLDIFMIVAVSDFNMGAMENKGLNIFNDKYILVRPDTATDADYANVEAIVAHEYFHNWTGNRITCRDWFQLCLKEGLTVFRDQQFTADQRSAAVKRISDVRMLKSHQFPEDAGPLAHAVRPQSYMEINNFYTATVYEKGAEIVRMLHTLLGADMFRAGMDLYFERHDGKAATVEDFIACFEKVSGRDLDQFMRWYNQAGTPELAVSGTYLPAEQCYEMSIEQSCPATPEQADKKPFHIPLKMALLDKTGAELPLVLENGDKIEGGIIEVTKTASSFRFGGITKKPTASVLRGFSAPVRLKTPLPERDTAFLMAHDNDLFNRWQVANDYALRILTGNTRALRSGEKPRKGQHLAEAMAATLGNETLEASYKALFITLPGEIDIAREIGKDIDPDVVHRAREGLRSSIGAFLEKPLGAVYEEMTDEGAYSPDAKSAGRRALRYAALSLLTAPGKAKYIKHVCELFLNASNMTDKIAALSIFNSLDVPERNFAFEHFYNEWKEDHLVIDKWFMLQAISPMAGTPENVEKLTRHELFSMQNPNRVRAVIGAFASSNPVNFNRADGTGYEFLARCIVELDSINAQIAARLTGALRNWRMLEESRRTCARAALEKIAKQDNLSRDVYEIATKSLA